MDPTPDPIGYGLAPPGHRLHPATRLGRVRLQVAGLQRSLDYYQGTLGFRVLSRSDGVATLAAHGEDVPLVALHERAGARPAPGRGRLGLYHFAILVPDRATLGRLLAHLGERRVPAASADHLVSEALYLQDPDGLGIEVYADRPRSTWRHEGRQLAMDTRPLDRAGVLAAGAGVPWRGMPAGTVIGHVHLHVGDIGEAEAFYHDGLGFDKVVWSYPGALFLSAGGYHHHLGLNTWAGPGATPPGDDDARLLDWELVAPGPEAAEAAARGLEAAGYPVERGSAGWLARDPWRTALRVTTD